MRWCAAEWIKRYASGSVAALRDKPKPSIPRGDRLALVHPDMERWYADCNDVSFETLPLKSNIVRFWKCRHCSEDSRDNVYPRKVADQVRSWQSGGGCLKCKGETISRSHLACSLNNSLPLDLTHPDLAKEFCHWQSV